MVIVPGDKQSEAGTLPDTQILTDMQHYNEELAKAGVMLGGEGLHPTSKGAKVRFDGDPRQGEVKRTVIDGPFTEAKELVAGFWLLQCKSKEECVEWVKRAPFGGGVEIEIRQIFETDEFAEVMSPELREAEKRLRAQLAEKQ
jgi:hypothetical protein